MKAPIKMKNESDVKAVIKDVIDCVHGWYYMHVPIGYGRSGIPDFTCCINGRCVMIEAKFSMRKTNGRQEEELEDARASGGVAIVVNQWGLVDMGIVLARVAKGLPVEDKIHRFQYKAPK